MASHSTADVAVGALLSGGLDSSIVSVRLAEKRSADRLPTPTFSFGLRNGDPSLCEMPFVDALVRDKHLQNFETTFDAQWVLDNLDDVLKTVEEPPLAMPILAQYRTFQLCRQHGTTVILDGQGSDEIFAGYPYDERLLILDRLRRRQWPAAVRELRGIARAQEGNSLSILAGYL